MDLQEDLSIISTQEKCSSLNNAENLNFNCVVHIDKLEHSKVDEIVNKPRLIVRIPNPNALIQKKGPEVVKKEKKHKSSLLRAFLVCNSTITIGDPQQNIQKRLISPQEQSNQRKKEKLFMTRTSVSTILWRE